LRKQTQRLFWHNHLPAVIKNVWLVLDASPNVADALSELTLTAPVILDYSRVARAFYMFLPEIQRGLLVFNRRKNKFHLYHTPFVDIREPTPFFI
jgi:hypothetical protein